MIIDGNHITAEEGKILYCTWNNRIYGNEVYIGYECYDENGVILPKPHKLTTEEFIEANEDDFVTIDNKQYIFVNKSYVEIKTFIVKLKYSNDDQIALMLNYQNNPDAYADRYNEMQAWREYAGEVARKYGK